MADAVEDRHISAPLALLADHFADSDGWSAWSWRNEEMRASAIRIANPDRRMAETMIADADRVRAEDPLRLEADAVERLVGELK